MANGNNNTEKSILDVFGEKSKDGDDVMDVLKKLISAPGNWLGTPYGGEAWDVEKEMPSYVTDPEEFRQWMEGDRTEYLRKGKYKKELPSFPYIAQTPFSRGNIPGSMWSRGDEIANILMSLILGGGVGFMGKGFAKGSQPHPGLKKLRGEE